MNRQLKLILTLVATSLVIQVHASSISPVNEYLRYHSDIQVALEEMDIKKAKSIVKALIPIVDSDIEYTKLIISEEEDEFFKNELTDKLRRQEKIRQHLEGFLKVRKNKTPGTYQVSMKMIKELRRLSMKPKER